MNFKKTVLENGVRIITVPIDANPTVTVMIHVCTGSFFENPAESGISHFLEHMCFKGTVKRPSARMISTELDSIGAQYNAFTSYDVTGYWAKADVKHFEKIADITADIFKNSTFPDQEIVKEKGVVVGEIDMYADDPQEKLSQALVQHMYAGEPAARDILGTKETVKSLTRAAITAYHTSQYTAPNIIVTMAGGISEDKMLAWARAEFSAVGSQAGKPEIATKDRIQTAPETVCIEKDTDQAHIVLAWRTFNKWHPDRYVSNVIKNLLRSGMSSRLFTKLRDDMGAGYYIGAHETLSTSFGNLMISTGTTHERVPEIIKAILVETERLKNEPVSEEELQKIKEFMRAHRRMSLETSDDVANYCAGQESHRGNILTPEEFDVIYTKINASDIMRVAKDVFNHTKLTVGVIGKGIDKAAIEKTIVSV